MSSPNESIEFDHDWHTRALSGDANAVTQLAQRTINPLFAFCLHRLRGDRHLCEEVVQEVLLRALRELPKYDPERSANEIFPWLQGLARNEIRRKLDQEKQSARWQAVWQRIDQDLFAELARIESQPINQTALDRQETETLVNAALSQLPPHYRDTLAGKYLHGRSVREIAAKLHVTEKTIESRLTRARTAFRVAFVSLAKSMNLEFEG
ncbi:RNA polymerase sigma factor [Thalassoroseus pseudoceratinae]|uniref:RNA polymerase sigma factor n=1 Tax=Thalassoroseus pseudoceratinae TaxID=2713176 RepID=UPI001421C96C|nr:sigma-70 family RNA polymerase sigma factor [Thalassoroseus pseudoceratinae]